MSATLPPPKPKDTLTVMLELGLFRYHDILFITASLLSVPVWIILAFSGAAITNLHLLFVGCLVLLFIGWLSSIVFRVIHLLRFVMSEMVNMTENSARLAAAYLSGKRL
jgi:hypothetical protein